jgi:superfamily II DNA or RNA helicase
MNGGAGENDRRRFSSGERAALYLAADGKCSECGAELRRGWHADHVRPWSHGGQTDMTNGQALCPECNLRKGDRVNDLRLWQQRAIDQYIAEAKQDFLLEATPGAGKTRFAAVLARKLLDLGTIERIAVVVPTDALRLQWCDATAGLIKLRAMDDSMAAKRGYDGVVVSYPQLARGTSADLLRREFSRHPTLGIFDEVHHAGKQRAWADGLTSAFDLSARRLSLTGTPWRRDNRPIPYVTYGEDRLVRVDYHYRYAAAVNDRVCRPIVFHAHTGDARWADCGQVWEAHVDEELDEEKTGAALDTLYHPDQQWMPAMLAKAAAALDDLRTEVPDAAGIVWAESKWLADRYAKLLHAITGEEPTVVHSGETDKDARDAKAKIDDFRTGHKRWLVSVQMVSEGVDIPRLSVGLFAAKKLTPLFFRQAVGRIVRKRSGEEDHNAQLFIPAVPVIVRHAYEIEQELLHELEQEEEQADRARKEARDYQQTLDFRTPLSTSEPVFTEAIHRGQGVDPQLLAEALDKCERHGLSSDKAPTIALILQEARMQPVEVVGQVTVRPVNPEPQHRLEARLRTEVERLARRLDYKEDNAPGTANRALLAAGFPKRKTATIGQLEDMRAWLARRLG